MNPTEQANNRDPQALAARIREALDYLDEWPGADSGWYGASKRLKKAAPALDELVQVAEDKEDGWGAFRSCEAAHSLTLARLDAAVQEAENAHAAMAHWLGKANDAEAERDAAVQVAERAQASALKWETSYYDLSEEFSERDDPQADLRRAEIAEAALAELVQEAERAQAALREIRDSPFQNAATLKKLARAALDKDEPPLAQDAALEALRAGKLHQSKGRGAAAGETPA